MNDLYETLLTLMSSSRAVFGSATFGVTNKLKQILRLGFTQLTESSSQFDNSSEIPVTKIPRTQSLALKSGLCPAKIGKKT